MIKAVIVFLVIMVAIGMLGNALFPGSLTRSVRKHLTPKKTSTCNRCGRHVIGKSGCDCGKS